MALSDRSDIESALTNLFQAQRTARRLAQDIAQSTPELVMGVLTEAIAAARSKKEEDERILELECVAQILGQLKGPAAVDALVEILGSEEPQARHTAGLMLEDIAFERFKEVALGIERALDRLPPDHLALAELPYVLVEIPEPEVPKLLHRFLDHPNEEVVAAGIEACVELGDPVSVSKLSRLEKDTRLVELEEEEDDGGHDGSVTIGELAKEARLMLEAIGQEDRP